MANYLIIGASSGIGKKLAEQLYESGKCVYATYFKNKTSSDNNLIEYHYLNVSDETVKLENLPDTPLAASLINSDQKKEANSRRHPLKRIGTTDDIVNMAEFLLSSKASWITGQIMHVDGGISTLAI